MVKRILLTMALLFVVAIATMIVVIALQPDTFAIERSATMAAPPAAIFAQVNDLEAWNEWSPWADLDPNAKTTISDPASGEGAKFTWDGNDQVGEGSLTIVESRPDELVAVEQEFVRPMPGKAIMRFILKPAGDETSVTYRMDGTNNFAGKAMCLVMDMDATLGPGFEQALANIKERVEQGEEKAD